MRVLVPVSSWGWLSCQLPMGAPEDPRTRGRAGRAVCVPAGVLCWAWDKSVPRPGLLVGWPPGLAPWRPQHLSKGALLGARGCPWLKPAGHGSAPAASRHTHAALAPLLAVRLALRPLVPEAGPAGLG